MARARNIKPGFFTNDELVALPFEARLLFIGLWTIADRSGRLLDRPKKIKMDVMPGDDVDIDACLNQLAEGGFITRYEVDGLRIVQVVNWSKHQNPHVKEVVSTIPAQGRSEDGMMQESDEHHATTVLAEEIPERAQEIPERAQEIPERAGLIPDSGFLIPDSGLPSTTSSPSDDVRQCPTGTLVNLYHELMPMNPKVKVVNAARKSAIKARWLEAAKLNCAPFGYATRAEGLVAWRQFFEVCAESKFLTGLSPPMHGKPAFFADIDFIFSPSGFAKTLENKYHRDAP